jgi:hypothetical protein
MVCKGKSTKMDDLGDRTTDALRQKVFLSAGAECQMFQGDTAIQEVMEDMKSSTLW